jgi:ring-1,2-phenylacetyl-CoA epoxidase subunit PaaE
MARFHALTVADVHHETPDSIVVSFQIPDALREEFRFTQGQYLTLKLSVNGEELRRSYSICSCPLDRDRLSIAVKKVPGGRASTQLVDKLKKSMSIEVMPPMGSFHTPMDAANAKHYVAFAAGSGITPIISILETVMRSEPKSRFTLFYGNRDLDTIIFREKLDGFLEMYGDRLTVRHILSRGHNTEPLLNGRIDREKAADLIKRYITDDMEKEFFICGPEEMMVNVKDALDAAGIDKKRIHIELFTTPVTAEAKAPPQAAGEGAFSGVAKVTVIIDGRESVLDIPASGDAVLDVALDAGLDVPYACKGAVCCTCKARVVKGQVEMAMNYALTDEEVADGFVLTCQTHPRSAEVIIDYDQH